MSPLRRIYRYPIFRTRSTPCPPEMVAGFLFVFNIPTLSLGWIWLKSRREEQVKAEMDKMRAQELE